MLNLLRNGRFYGNLNEWSGTGSIARSLGYPRLGCAEIDDGESISQQVGLTEDALYTLHFFYRLGAGATLTAGYGASIVLTANGTESVWHEAELVFAPDASANDSVTFSAAGGTCYVDAVTLLVGGLPISRGELAGRVHARLGDLATDAGLNSSASASGDQGSYSAAIDEALRAVGAIGKFGEPDITELNAHGVNTLIDSAHMAMLGQLRAKYALETDVTLGPHRESRSQIVKNISALMGGGADGKSGGGGGRVSMADLNRTGGWIR